MAKKVYLVDTENIGSAWIKLLELVTKQDDLILFYTEHSPAVSYQDLQRVLEYTDRFEFIHCYAGRNGLDFQLVTYLGYLLKSAPKTDYVVVSNDMGFDTVIKFWTERDKRVTRLTATKINFEYNKLKKSESGAEVDNVSAENDSAENIVAPKVISVSRSSRGSSAANRNRRVKEKSPDPICEEVKEENGASDPVTDTKDTTEKVDRKKTDSRKKTASDKTETEGETPAKAEPQKKRGRPGKAVLTKLKNDTEKAEVHSASEDARVEVEANDTPSTFIYRVLCDILKMEEIDWLYGMLCDHPLPETGLNVIYNEIIKHFAQEKGLLVYKKLKPNIGHFTELLKY